jgi:PAS domain S-box-containing protein
MNRVASELTGWSEEESHGQPLENVFSLQREHDEPPVKMDWKSTGTLLVSRDGNRRPISLTVAPMPDKANQGIGHVLVFRDVTDQRRMEQELLKTRKLESLQVIAGGIAHDFNNFLTAVLGNISLASALTRGTAGNAHQLLAQAEQATLLARNLTQQLLTFAKGGEPVKTLASLSEVLHDSAGFLLRGSQVRCEYDMPEDLWPVEIDTGLMSQVIQNIILNASDAMSGTGVIRIRCQNVHLEAGMHPALPPGRYVLLTITDPGAGILPEIQEKIFDPFFSTKPGGTGLGLAITHSIVTRHGGHIGVQSRPGGGSTFAIHLPASIANAVSQPEPLHTGTGENAASPVEKLARRVLIMDDDPLLRTTLGSLLEFLGYDVVPSAEGQEAINLYRAGHQQGFPFDLVIMDLTIPGGMGGREAVKILRDIEPAVQVIVSSGFSDDPIMSRFAENGFSGVLTKPYRLEDLEKVLSRIPWTATTRSSVAEAIPPVTSVTPSKRPPGLL